MRSGDQEKAAKVKGLPEGLDVTGTELEPVDCEDVVYSAFIEPPDGTYYGLKEGVSSISIREQQKQLKSAGKPAISDAKIAQLREDGFVK
ncbi:hypothetical protein FGRMN_5209 [Fusarium graminum]|nr:hypothetical protein FGRMN_5209 [Fusarium graminum]